MTGSAGRGRNPEHDRTGVTAETKKARDTAEELWVDVHVLEVDLREHRRLP